MKRFSGLPLIAVAIGFALPLFAQYHWLNVANVAGIAAIVAIGLVVLTGVGGMTSFAQAVFVGMGAYTTAWLTTAQGWSPIAALVPSLLVTAGGAFVVGVVTVRLSGHFLALGTVAWAISFYYLFGSMPQLGLHTGISSIPPVQLGSFDFTDPGRFWILVWSALVLTTSMTLNLLDSRCGRALRALRGGGDVARSFGIDATRAKLWLFVYAALLAGLAGWLLAHFQRSVSPSLFGINAGVEYLLMAVVGGAGYVYGAIAGAVLVVVLREQLQTSLPTLLGQTGNFESVVFGVILLGVLLAAREGLWPRLTRHFPGRPPKPVQSGIALTAQGFPPRGTELLVARSLMKRFGGVLAVNDVSLSLRAGEIIGLIGPNGAGKSTTFHLLTGMLRASSGRLQILGKEIDSITPRQAADCRIGRTFQHVKLVGGMTVLENVALGAHRRGVRGAMSAMLRLEREEEARILAEAARQIERVGLESVMHRQADSLSLGQLRMVEIARALALDPMLLLLDEPAAGLRYQEKVALGDLLRKLSDEGMAVLIVEHDMDFVMNLVHGLVVLDFGSRIAEGSPEEVRRNPAVVGAYLGVTA